MSFSEWYPLCELANIKYGKNQTKVLDDKGVYPIYGTGGLMGYASSYLYNKPSVLIGRKGSISKVKYVEHPFWTVDTLFYTVINENKVIPRYLYYRLSLIDFNYYNEGTTIPSLRTDTLNKIEVDIPQIDEQKAIVSLLTCLDDKIELNNRINKTLEEMAQAIFKSWFIDFEPFQEGEFEDSELGRIPKGWKVVCIDDVTSNSNTGGDAIQKTPMVDYNTGIKCVRVGDLTNQRGIEGWGYSNVTEENFKKYQLKKNDIVVTRTASIGLNQIIDEDLMAVYNNGLIRIKLSKKTIPLFFYQSINTDDYKEYIGRIESESSTRPNMKMNYLLKYKFVFPPIEIQENFVDIIGELRQQRLNLYKQTHCILNIRDTLLPKLMSGEIRVPIEEV